MFNHLLLPTDGSPSSEDTIRQAIASHGRQGLRTLLLGSESLKVLANSNIPETFLLSRARNPIEEGVGHWPAGVARCAVRSR
jgi:hypothetical protein